MARAGEILEDRLGVKRREGGLSERVGRCSRNLSTVERQITAALTPSAVIHTDDTGVRVGDARWWAHVTSTPTVTHALIHQQRGQQALHALGIVPAFPGPRVHDGDASSATSRCAHALCTVHLWRELVFLSEDQGWWWAATRNTLLLDRKEATEHARARGTRVVHPRDVRDWQQHVLVLLAEGDRAHPRATAPPGHVGRVTQTPSRHLVDRVRTHQQALWAFLEDLRVPFDNHLAQRDLRLVNVQQTISGCFRSVAAAPSFARIRGSLSALRTHG